MSTEVQVPQKGDFGSDKQPRRRNKDTEKAHRRSSNFQNKKHKHDHKFQRKRSQSLINGKSYPLYKLRKNDFFIPPTKFLLGGNITDPLNLNSLQDEDINRAMNAVTPKSSPLPTPRHRKGEVEVIIPRDITDPLNLIAGDDDATYEAMLTSPLKKTQKKQKKKNKRRNHRSSSGPGSGKEDSIEGAKLDHTDPSPDKEKPSSGEEKKDNTKCEMDTGNAVKEPNAGPTPKRHKSDNSRSSLRKMELKEMKERKAEMDKIVSPVIPQPGAWNDRHRFRPPPQINKAQATPKFNEKDSKFQFGNYNRYYGYRNPNLCSDMRIKVLEKHKHLFEGKDILDIGCNTGHLTLTVARDFGSNKVVGVDIDRSLIQVARNNIKHYVNCGKKDTFFPVSMPIVYGPINVPGVNEDKAFPHNISFIQGNYVLESDVLLAMEQPQFDVILCLSITKWLQLNWGDAGLKRAFKRMYAQLRPGGVLLLEAQSWASYKKKKGLTPEIWKNYHNIELFPHQFSQYLLSEVGFSKCEVIGAPMNQSRGFQRPIKLFIKEGTSFDTPVYSASTSAYSGGTPYYCKDTPGQMQNLDRHSVNSWRLPDNIHTCSDESGSSSRSYQTPTYVNSPESGFSEGLHRHRRLEPRALEPPIPERPADDFPADLEGSPQNQREIAKALSPDIEVSLDQDDTKVDQEVFNTEDSAVGKQNCEEETNSMESDRPQNPVETRMAETALASESITSDEVRDCISGRSEDIFLRQEKPESHIKNGPKLPDSKENSSADQGNGVINVGDLHV